MLTAVKTAGQGDVGGGGSAAGTTADAAFSARQNEVLEVALKLLVEGGDKALTTAALARAANCSKESLYKWFGDRDGLLAAIVTHQASRVRRRRFGATVGACVTWGPSTNTRAAVATGECGSASACTV